MRLVIAVALGLAGCASAPEMTADQEIEAFMRDYAQAWNKHDVAAFARDFYRNGRTVDEIMAWGKKTFDDLDAQGYARSDFAEIKGCVTGPDTGWGGWRFTRRTTDGGFMPPKDRAAVYDLKKFADGWRIVASASSDAAKPLECPGPEQAVEQFMWDYTKAWNRHDSATIARDFYRTGPTVAEQTASLERGFENLRGQGYHHSDIFEVKGCMTGPDTAWAGMKLSRLKADGEPLPPKDRASSYTLTKFADGWRITKVGAGGVSAETPLACPASP